MGQLAAVRNCSSGSTARSRSRAARADRALDPRRHPRRPPRRRGRGCRRAGRSPASSGVSRGVVTEAYGQLAAEGYLHTRQGAPVRVASAVRASAPRAPARSLLPSFAYHFHPGLPDLAGFPRDRWLRSLRAAWRQAPIDGDRLRRPARRAGAARGARRVPRPRPRRRHRPRAHADLHRLHPGPLAALPLAGGAGSRAGRARGPGLAPAPADRRAGRPRGRAGPGRRRGPAGRPAARRAARRR